jgi:hypothetical protein
MIVWFLEALAAMAPVLPRHRGYADGGEWGVSHYWMKAAS